MKGRKPKSPMSKTWRLGLTGREWSEIMMALDASDDLVQEAIGRLILKKLPTPVLKAITKEHDVKDTAK